jgi:hypothetical protein
MGKDRTFRVANNCSEGVFNLDVYEISKGKTLKSP